MDTPYLVTPDGRVWIPETLVTLPDPVTLPACFVAGPEFNGRLAILNNDDTPRTLNLPLKQTNEISVLRPIRSDGLKVDPRSKVTFNINDAWATEFYRLNGQWVTDWLFSPAIGWFDIGYPTFNMLGTGGNLVLIKQDGFQFPGYVEIETQDFTNDPLGYDYDVSPHMVIKQTLVTARNDQTFILVDKGERGGFGDTYIPLVSNTRTFVSTYKLDQNEQGITILPNLPAKTKLHDVEVTVTSYAFHGSNTYVQVDNKWYLGEEMLVTGNINDKTLGGTQEDRRTYCDLFKKTPCRPPRIGWTRQS